MGCGEWYPGAACLGQKWCGDGTLSLVPGCILYNPLVGLWNQTDLTSQEQR